MKVKAESKCISCLCQKCKNKRDFFGERYCACKKFREKFGAVRTRCIFRSAMSSKLTIKNKLGHKGEF